MPLPMDHASKNLSLCGPFSLKPPQLSLYSKTDLEMMLSILYDIEQKKFPINRIIFQVLASLITKTQKRNSLAKGI